MQAKRNIIVSHGGVHGRTSRTYREGQAVRPADETVIPTELLAHEDGTPAAPSAPASLEARKVITNVPPEEPKPQTPAVAEPPVQPKLKRDLIVMKKADVEVLATSLGINVAEDQQGRTQLLKDLIAAKLGL